MIKLKPKLVSVSLTTRVVAPTDLSEEELVKIAKEQIIENRLRDIEENVESIEEDTESPITEKEKKDWIINKFSELLIASNDMEIDTFQFCADTGAELDHSTIDKIVSYFPRKEIRIYYNINTYDGKNIEDFDAEDLIQFYDKLVKWLDEQEGSNRMERMRKYMQDVLECAYLLWRQTESIFSYIHFTNRVNITNVRVNL